MVTAYSWKLLVDLKNLGGWQTISSYSEVIYRTVKKWILRQYLHVFEVSWLKTLLSSFSSCTRVTKWWQERSQGFQNDNHLGMTCSLPHHVWPMVGGNPGATCFPFFNFGGKFYSTTLLWNYCTVHAAWMEMNWESKLIMIGLGGRISSSSKR